MGFVIIIYSEKRARRGTGSKILKEYGDLYNSIRIDEHAGLYATRVYTDVVHANASHHKNIVSVMLDITMKGKVLMEVVGMGISLNLISADSLWGIQVIWTHLRTIS